MKIRNIFIAVLVLFGLGVSLHSQNYDTKYTVVYALKDAAGNELSNVKLFRNAEKMKFQKVSNSGKPDESTTDIYINKNDPKIHTVITNSAGKFGGKYDLDIMYVFMNTGIYVLDLGHDGKIFNGTTKDGSGNVLGMDCVQYTVASDGSASSKYYMYQDNLMLKRTVGNSTEGNSIESLTYDNTSDVPESIFLIPSDVQYTN